MSLKNKPELLSPAGSMESLKAAVNNGCDAVYLGGKAFSARQYAGNFSLEELEDFHPQDFLLNTSSIYVNLHLYTIIVQFYNLRFLTV